ncbi:MAG: PAS domain S-box protein [Methanomassiliicoccales archaeon]|nr:PAS domain S-box protein [Methanomassiliicoccales archaeon]
MVSDTEGNITLANRAEQALRETEARFDQLAEQSNTVTWEADADGLFIYVSSVSEVVWGYRPDELVGKKHFFDLVVEAERETIKSKAFEVLKHKERFVGLEHAVLVKDGRTLWNSTSGIPLLNAAGTLRGYQGRDTDIIERKKVEKLRKTKEEDNPNDIDLTIRARKKNKISKEVRIRK